MADVVFGVVGVVGVALDAAITTYNFLSNIIGAPKAIKNLASHIQTLELAQNLQFIPSVESAVAGFKTVLKSLDDEVKQYVKYETGSSKPVWGGWGSWRRVKYAFNKSSMIELEASLLGRMSALHMVLAPMDLSWTMDLTNEDRETITTLQRRADSLDVRSISGTGSTLSMASHMSWAGIEDPDPAIANSPPETETRLDEAIQYDTHEEAEEEIMTYPWSEDDDPFVKQAVVWCGDYQLPVVTILDSGSTHNFVTKGLVTRLKAPVNRMTAPLSVTLFSDGLISIMETVLLGVRFIDSSESVETRFYVLPPTDTLAADKILLGLDWIRNTETFTRAKRRF